MLENKEDWEAKKNDPKQSEPKSEQARPVKTHVKAEVNRRHKCRDEDCYGYRENLSHRP